MAENTNKSLLNCAYLMKYNSLRKKNHMKNERKRKITVKNIKLTGKRKLL